MLADPIHCVLLAKADALIRRNSQDLAALIHPNFVYVNASGELFNKDSYIDTYCVSGQVVFLEQTISDLQVRQFDGFAVAALVLHDKLTVSEQIAEGSYQSLCVFSAAGDWWLWAAGQTIAHKTEL